MTSPPKPTRPVKRSPAKTLRPLLWIMVAVLVWGSFHALGAYLFDLDIRKALIVYACVGAFLGVWLLLLLYRWRFPPASKFPSDKQPPGNERGND